MQNRPKSRQIGSMDFLRRLIAGVVLLNAAVLCLTAFALIHSYRHYQQQADVTTQNLAGTLSGAIRSTVDQVDIGLMASKDEIERRLASGKMDAASLTAFMSRMQYRLPWVVSLRATDEHGIVMYGNDVPKDNRISIADRDYFVHLRDAEHEGIYVGKPVLSRINKIWLVNFGRRLNYPDGRFAGVVFAGISLENFSKMFATVDVGPLGAINLRDDQMSLISRHPQPQDMASVIGDRTISAEFHQILKSNFISGTFYTPTSFDYTARIVSYQKIGDYPLYVTVGLARDDFLYEWKREAAQMSGFVVLFLLLSGFGVVLLQRSWREQEYVLNQLAKEEQKFHTVADYTYDWEYWEGEAGKILYMSPSCERVTGYPSAAFLEDANLLTRIVHAEDRALVDQHRHDTVHQSLEELDYRIVRVDGEVRWISHCCQTVYAKDGTPLGRRVSNRDITERKLDDAVNAARLHLVRFSLSHSLDELLEETLNLTERLTGSLIGFYHFVDDDQNSLSLQNWSTRTKNEFCRAEGTGLHHPIDGAGIWADCVRQKAPIIHNDYAAIEYRKGMPEGHAKVIRELVVPVFRGERVSAILGVGNKPTDYNNKDLEVVSLVADLAWEIAERKRNEDELKRYKDHLEEKVQQRTADLVLARNAAEAANKAKSVFLASMSHELRTPLNAILGFSNMIRGDAHLPENLRQYLQIINRSGEHLLTLINDVLEMAKIEAGRVQLENAPFDLGAMVRDVTDMMEFRAKEKGLRLLVDQTSEFPRYIVGDEARLRQVLINLVGNAIKFTVQGGVTVRLGTKQNSISHLLIEVEDSGPGISAKDQERIFDPFVQLGEQRDNKGTGLGLTITRQFVHMMGGKIILESTQGKGSLFRVDLPLKEAHESDIVKVDHGSHGSIIGLQPGQPEYRILVVEDQLENQLLLERLMESVGFKVRVVENGKKGVEAFGEWHPHLIWMDRKMPVMDGVEATRRIRALPGGKDVKIVAVTASAFQEQRAEMLDIGMDDFVRKPYRFNEIYDCLSRHLGVRYLREDEPDTGIGESATLSPDMLLVLPPELRQELASVLETLESDRIADTIRKVRDHDAMLGKVLSHLASGFDYPAILTALKSISANPATAETTSGAQ